MPTKQGQLRYRLQVGSYYLIPHFPDGTLIQSDTMYRISDLSNVICDDESPTDDEMIMIPKKKREPGYIQEAF